MELGRLSQGADILRKSIKLPIPVSDRDTIISAIWGENHGSAALDLGAYFEFYREVCYTIWDRPTWDFTHEDVVLAAKLIRERQSKEEIKKQICANKGLLDEPQDNAVDSFISMAGFLISMCVRFEEGGVKGLCHGPPWNTGTLQDLLEHYFYHSSDLNEEHVRFDGLLARNLALFAQIEIEWTDHLGDHLRLKNNDSTVLIYYHASVLQCHNEHPEIFPDGFIQETLDTLALLFPENDQRTQKWIRNIHRSSRVKKDAGLLNCGQLTRDQRRPEHFKYWHDRLIMLNEALNETREADLRALMLDRKNPQQWFNSWIAIFGFILTVVFGLIQAVTGSLQVWRAYNRSEEG